MPISIFHPIIGTISNSLKQLFPDFFAYLRRGLLNDSQQLLRRECLIGRCCPLTGIHRIKILVQFSHQFFPFFVLDMRVGIDQYVRRRMARHPLHRFNIPIRKQQLIRRIAVAQAVELDFLKFRVFGFPSVKHLPDSHRLHRVAVVPAEQHLMVMVFLAQLLLMLPTQHQPLFQLRFQRNRQINKPFGAFVFGRFQNENGFTGFLLARKHLNNRI